MIFFLILDMAVIAYKFFVDKEELAAKKEDAQVEEEKVAVSEYTIELNGETSVTIKLGDEFTDPGVVVKDSKGNIVETPVEIEKDEFITAGEHKILYKAVDSKGVEAQAERLVTITPNTDYGAKGLPICMYHYVYEASNPPESIDANFIEVSVLEEELKYLQENGYYFPTWKEVREYLDGERILPEKSIVLSFDDSPHYITLGIPLFEKYQTLVTSFVITSYYDSKEMLYGYKNDYLLFESHSHNMHRGGGSGTHGGIFPSLSYDEAMADLQKSIEFCGSGEAFAYPFGDYDEECKQILEDAGFLCAVTTEPGLCYPGDDPYALKRVRMVGSQSLEGFIGKIQ